MVCGLAVIALVFSIIALVFEVLGVVFCILNLVLPEKPTPSFTFEKLFVIAHIGVYFGTIVFYLLHFLIKKYKYKYEKVKNLADNNYKKYDVCPFGFPVDNNKKIYGYDSDIPSVGNGYTVYWGHIFLFIVGVVGLVVSILYLLPLKIKVFSLIYVIVGFVHIFVVWVVFLSVSVPDLYGDPEPFCNVGDYDKKTIPVAGWKPGCLNGFKHGNRKYNLLWSPGKKYIEYEKIDRTPSKFKEIHTNGFHPWFFSYELVFFIVMSVFYIGFVLVHFNIDFKASLLAS